MILKYILPVLMIFALSGPGWTATYYMRSDGTAANKTAATGPASNAAACMNEAVHDAQTFSSGDIILLSSQGGKFTEMHPPSSGGADYIYYKNVPGETPVINTSVAIADGSWTSIGGGRYTTTTTTTNAHLYDDNVVIPVSSDGSTLGTPGTCYRASGSSTLYYRPASGAPTNCSVLYNTIRAGFHLISKSKLYFTSNTTGSLKFENCSQGIFCDETTGTGNTNIVIDNCDFYYCHDAFLSNPAGPTRLSTGTFKNNYGYCCNSFFRAYGTQGTTWTVEDNYAWGTGTADDGVTKQDMIGEYTHSDREFVGFQNADGCIVRRNTSVMGYTLFFITYQNAGNQARNTDVYNNFCYKNQRTFMTVNGYGANTAVNNFKIYNNIGLDIGGPVDHYQQCGAYFVQLSTSATARNSFYNNVIVGGYSGLYFYDGASYSGAMRWDFRNNILRGQTRSVKFGNVSLSDDLTFDYNLYEGNYFAGNNVTWWQSQGQDTHGPAGGPLTDPLLTNESGDDPADAALQTGSPAINAGLISTRAVRGNIDYYGRFITPDKTSIGAIEYYRTGLEY